MIKTEECEEDEINYVFCDDEYLHKLNVDFLKHDTLTDIISFDYSVGKNYKEIFIFLLKELLIMLKILMLLLKMNYIVYYSWCFTLLWL